MKIIISPAKKMKMIDDINIECTTPMFLSKTTELLNHIQSLEYSELKLFKQLFEWQINQDGLPEEIKEIEKHCIDKTSEECLSNLKPNFNDWCKPKVIKWIQVEPQLSQIDLRDYFQLLSKFLQNLL